MLLNTTKERFLARKKRHKRVRKNIFGTSERPRLSVFRSTKHIYVQIINDLDGKTITSASTMNSEIKEKIKYGGNIESAKIVGQLIAKKGIEAGVKEVTFDRGGNLYHGRVKALADAAREGGLVF